MIAQARPLIEGRVEMPDVRQRPRNRPKTLRPRDKNIP